jgi:CRP/FNR family cyclic AMP-dependent transcriptional regulator
MSPGDLSTLAETGWLAAQPAAFRAWAARAGRWRAFEQGQTLYQQGDPPDGLYGLASGVLEIQIPLNADEQITIHRAEPGFWIGESAILARTSRSITVMAAVKSRVFFIPAAAMRAGLEEEPLFWYSFFELSHINATRAVATLAEVFSRSPQERLARMLLRLADADGKVAATQEDLARLIGMTRSSLRRILAELIDTGAVEAGYRSLQVVDRARLRKVIGES